MFNYWAANNCTERANNVIMTQLEGGNVSLIAEYQRIYGELLKTAKFDNFDEERLHLDGRTFRKLVRTAVGIVVDNYYELEEKCQEQWNFHRSVQGQLSDSYKK